MASGLRAPQRRFLTTSGGQVVAGQAVLAQQALGPQREEGGRGGQAGLLLPGREERRADDAAGHLLDAHDEHRVVLPGADGGGGQGQRGAARRAPGLDVDDGDAGQGQRAEHAMAGGHAAVGGGAERGADLAPGVGRRRPAGVGQAVRGGGDAHVGGGRLARTARTGAGPTPAISTPFTVPHGPVGAKAQIRLPAGQRLGHDLHRLAEGQRVGVGLGQPADHPQALARRARPSRTRRAPAPS